MSDSKKTDEPKKRSGDPPKMEPPAKPPQSKRGGAVEIKNKLQQPLTITLAGGKTLYLSARGTAQISEEDLASPSLQQLINQRHVLVFGR